ncbi:myomegalin isoform X2 [Ranitomeya variabilis]|uniref:myomegalin isoform X2 n=1 Tax=Ranitomeya variabilis TaxID=490064 RepID=UPI0040572CB7
MLDLKMKDVCRICSRELCGNQRRWIFHSTAKLNLQVILSHILGKEILRDGSAEFACSKCAFMLERFYRFDTVIARIEALSIDRLQKLLSEKDRLKHCLASLYIKHNNEEGLEARARDGTGRAAHLSEVQYSYTALLQEDFAFSGFEYWTELEEAGQEIQHCSHHEGTTAVPRKCHGCSSLRVADSDYEAICKVPRRIAQNISSGQMSTCTSTYNNLVTIPHTSENEATNDKILSDGDGLDRLSSAHSAESLPDIKDPGCNLQKAEEKVRSNMDNLKCHCSSCTYAGSTSGYIRKLDLALSLVKMFNYKPVQSPKGSKIPIKSCSIIKSTSTLNSAQSSVSNTGISFPDNISETSPKMSQDFLTEISDLHELWYNVYEDYIPIDMQNLVKKKGQDALHYENLLEQQASNLQKAGMEAQALQGKVQESKDLIKTLQEFQQQLTNKLNSAHELTHNQECVLQSLRDTLQSRDHEVMELYQIVDEHNATIAKLQDVLLKGQNEQLQTFQEMPTQLQFLDLQNTLFSTQMELQKKQMALRQKERQLTEAKISQRLLEVDILEGQQQKETTWKHNQEYIDVLHYQQSLEKVSGGNEYMMEKLRQRIKERDVALQKAVDDKFCAVEEKEKEVQRLKMIIREREHDVERLSNVLSGNEETINSLDNLVKAKDMELEQISAAYKNLQWVKQETEEKYVSCLNERESIIHQLQKNLQERSEEIQEIRTCIVGKADICTGDMIEELKMCLQRKEKMLQDAVFARNQQAEEHMREVMDLLSMISSEKMDQSSICQCRLLKEQNAGVNKSVENLSNFVHLEKQEKEKLIQAFTQSYSVQPLPISIKSEDFDAKDGVTENNDTLKSDLAQAKEDLTLVLRKMREYQLEVSALQSIIMKQNEQLREQAADIDALTRNIQIKEELIKDLQVKLVDPEDIPTVELLTQQIFTLKETIVSLNLTSQGHLRHTQKIFMLLEELAANKSQLNEALQAEKRLYSCLVQFHTETDSSAIHNELLAAQALRAQLEDNLMRTMEQLVALQAERKLSGGFGGLCDNSNSAEKKLNQLTECHNGSDEILKEKVQKLKNQLQQLITKKNRVEEELHVCKRELAGALKLSTPDLRNWKHDQCQKEQVNLNVEKTSGTLQHWIEKVEMEEGMDLAKELRKPKAQINLDDKNQYFMGKLETNNTVKSNTITNDTKVQKYVGTDINPALSSQSRLTSLKRSLSGSNPVNEEFKILKKALGIFHLLDENCPASSCTLAHSSILNDPQQVLFETQNTKVQNTSISLNKRQSESLLDGFLLNQDTREVHMDFQDLGYETCGKSENEIDREETSPECEADNDIFTEINHMVEKDSNYQYQSHRTSMTSSENKNFWLTDQKSDAKVLKEQVKKLKGQLQTSMKLMLNLQSQSCPSSKSHSLTEDDEGWQSESTGQHPYTFLEQLSTRVSKLESYFYPLTKITGNQGQMKPVFIPGKYDWLIQAQAQELSLLRQKAREGQSLCRFLTQHVDEVIKSFEEMLRANDIDYFMGQSFREQLSQENELVKKMNSKLNIKGFSNVNKNMNEDFLLNSSHGSSESDGSVILDDQLSNNDEFDGGSELSVKSDCYCYDQESTQDSDLCCNTIVFNNAPHMDTNNRNGHYIFCHTEDFSALKKNILDGKTLLHNIETCLQSILNIPFLEVHGGKGMDCGNINKLFSNLTILHNMLEESNSVLSLCWSGTQPTKQVNKKQNEEEQVIKGEICTLKCKQKEQEKLLKKASNHVKYANLAREGMEKQIMEQLTTTYGALKKARLNLQVKRSHNGLELSHQLT